MQEELSQPLWFTADVRAQLLWNFPGCKVCDLFRSGEEGQSTKTGRKKNKSMNHGHLLRDCWCVMNIMCKWRTRLMALGSQSESDWVQKQTCGCSIVHASCMKMHVRTEEQADTITLMLPAIKNPHKVHLLQYAVCPPPPSLPRASSLGRILMSGGATDGHEENKCMGTMVLFL